MGSKVYFFGGIFGILVGIIMSIQAAYGWTLTVNVTGVQFGHSSVTVNLEGPYGYKDFNNIPNGPSPSTSFEVPEDAVPVGTTYKVCGHSEGIVNALLESCSSFVHDHEGDSVVSLDLREAQQ